MKTLPHLFKQNKDWVDRVLKENPNFFDILSKQQFPEILWIGCSDSRVPANQITGLLPGEVFVHRNIANIVKADDVNCQAVLQYAVQVLQVKHIIICGHYGCGGVRAAYQNDAPEGPVKRWLDDLVPVLEQNKQELNSLASDDERVDRCCELNVLAQVRHVSNSQVVQEAWQNGMTLNIHAWIYSIKNGLLKDLDMSISSRNDQQALFPGKSPEGLA